MLQMKWVPSHLKVAGSEVVDVLRGSGTHRARTVHLFYLDNLLDTVVLLCCWRMRCCVGTVSWYPISPYMP